MPACLWWQRALTQLCESSAQSAFSNSAPLGSVDSKESWIAGSPAKRPVSLMACQKQEPQTAGRRAVSRGKVHSQISGQIACDQSADVPAFYRQTTLKPVAERRQNMMCAPRARTRGRHKTNTETGICLCK